jgi:hypothetical protein
MKFRGFRSETCLSSCIVLSYKIPENQIMVSRNVFLTVRYWKTFAVSNELAMCCGYLTTFFSNSDERVKRRDDE